MKNIIILLLYVLICVPCNAQNWAAHAKKNTTPTKSTQIKKTVPKTKSGIKTKKTNVDYDSNKNITSDSHEFVDLGYARALEEAKDYTQAIAIYEQYQQLDEIGADEKNAIYKNISDCYKNLGDYDKAVDFYSKYVNSFEKPSFTMQEDVIKIYTSLIQNPSTSDEQKMDAYKKADAIYATLLERYPDNAVYVANKRGTLPFYLAIEDMKKLEMAGPHFQTLANIVEAKGEGASAGEKKVLASAYNYLIPFYAHIKNDMDTTKALAEKLIVLDPNNGNAKAILGITE